MIQSKMGNFGKPARTGKVAILASLLASCALWSSPAYAGDAAQTDKKVQEVLNQGYKFWQQGNVAKARSHLEYALQMQPKEYRILAMKGLLNAQQGDYEQAVEDMKLAAVYAQTKGETAAAKRLFAKAMDFQSQIDSYAKKQAERAKALAAEALAQRQVQTQTKTQAHGQAQTQSTGQVHTRAQISSTKRQTH